MSTPIDNDLDLILRYGLEKFRQIKELHLKVPTDYIPIKEDEEED